MFTHWHIEAEEEHWLCRWVREALAGQHRGWRFGGEDLVSWGLAATPGGVEWKRFPDLRRGQASSVDELRVEADSDRFVTLRPSTAGGEMAGPGGAASWVWLGCGDGEVAIPLAPPAREALEPGTPAKITLLGGAWAVERWSALVELGRDLRARLPEWSVELRLDPAALAAGWTGRVDGISALTQLGEFPLGSGEVVVLLERDPGWSAALLEASRRGRSVIAPANSVYARLLEPTGAWAWDGSAAGLGRLVTGLRADPVTAEARRRKGRAWSRRWAPERSLGHLRDLAGAVTGPTGANGRARHWTLRREVGIGDVVFTLAVGAELKRRDPSCRLTLHTSPQHQEWVSWFPHVDRVRCGPVVPDASECVGDFETDFPMAPSRDRTLALAAQIGVRPERWLPPPTLPPAVRRRAAELLGPGMATRIAFVPVSKGRSSTRSLLPALARELARRLGEYGQVVWLEEEQADQIPASALDLSGRCSVPETLGVLEACDLCVSVDSGLLYLAAALGKPVVGVFSHIGALQRLWMVPRFLAIEPALPCAPCGEGPDSLHCQGPVRRVNMLLPCAQLDWTPHVLDAVRRLLELRPSPARQVWRVAPDGNRVELDVDRVPRPWAMADG